MGEPKPTTIDRPFVTVWLPHITPSERAFASIADRVLEQIRRCQSKLDAQATIGTLAFNEFEAIRARSRSCRCRPSRWGARLTNPT